MQTRTSDDSSPRTPEGMLETLDRFFSLVDTDRLLDSQVPSFYRTHRDDLSDAFYTLLVRERPLLEAEKGIQWPYEALSWRADYFKRMSIQANRPFMKEQARLFLARLPFPEQWHWLSDAEKKCPRPSGNDCTFKDRIDKYPAEDR